MGSEASGSGSLMEVSVSVSLKSVVSTRLYEGGPGVRLVSRL